MGTPVKHNPRNELRRAGLNGQLVECAAVLRMLAPLSASRESSVDRQRRLLADVFRLIGDRLVEPADRDSAPLPKALPSRRPVDTREELLRDTSAALSPRLGQTLTCLLAGHSEKEAAQQLGLSPHTVHVYVKELYRRFGVSSRAELLARHVRRW